MSPLVLIRRVAVIGGAALVLGLSITLYLQPHQFGTRRPIPDTSNATTSPLMGTVNRFREVQPLSASTAIVWMTAVPGNAQHLYRSSDQGRSWTELPSPPLTSEKYGFQAVDSNTVLVQLSHGLLATPDGGGSWRSVDLPTGQTFGLGARFLDATHGWYQDIGAYPGQAAQPSAMWWTADGGGTWSQLWQVNSSSPTNGEVPLIGSKHVLGFQGVLDGWLSVTEAVGSRLLRTRDGGHTWGGVTLPLADVSFFLPLEFGQDGSIVLLAKEGADLIALVSADGGETWGSPQRLPSVVPAPGSQNRSAFADRNHWMVANGLMIERTDDGGKTWIRTKPGLPVSITALENLWFFGSTHGWATARTASGTEQVLNSSDGGRTWSTAKLPGSA